MEITYAINSGWPSQITSTMRRRVSGYTRDASFKIGITSAPNQGAAYYSNDYDEMVLLYETSSISNVRQLEKELIEYYEGWCDNEIAGGGGSIGTQPYYLYIVRSR